MDWEQALINFGIVAGFLALMGFWVGLSMWMRIDADKRGLVGWVWIFVGLLTGPVGLIAYILYRSDRPVLEIVNQRDELISETSRAHMPVDYDPDAPPPASLENPPSVDPVNAALEAEERRYRNY